MRLTSIVGGVGIEEGDGFAFVAAAAGTPDAVNVFVDVTRKIVVDHHLRSE